MKKFQKITALVLTLALCFSSVTASATSGGIANEGIPLLENSTAMEARGTPTSTIISGTVYNIVNANSGKYLNVHYGYDSNGINVYQWTADGSDEQQFRVVYDSASASYKIYAMCSSNGTNRVLDIERNGAAVAAGQNVEIWTPVDPTAQNWTLTNMGNGYFKISPKANTSLALTAYGTSNGTGSGRTSTSAGNVYLSVYDTYISQLWTFEEVTSAPAEQPYGRLEAIYGNTIVGYAWRSDIPNMPIYVKIYITDSNGEDVPGSPFTVEANIYRDYLQAAGYGNGVHGFELNYPWEALEYGTYTVEAFAIASGGGTVGLVASPKLYTVENTIGYLGYAVYRDLDLTSLNWHAALMRDEYIYSIDSQGNTVDIDCIVHMPGENQSVEINTWSEFLLLNLYQEGKPFNGAYIPRETFTHYDRLGIVALANELAIYDITYSYIEPIDYDERANMVQVEPFDITNFRCDGFVEYCYEYYGYRIYGDDENWDISNPNTSSKSEHNGLFLTPKTQAQDYMTLVTGNAGDMIN